MTRVLSRVGFTIVVLFVSGAPFMVMLAGSVQSGLQPAWEHQGSAAITSVALSSNGDCLAVSTAENVTVLDLSGRESWGWAFSSENRFTVARNVAVSPSCDWLAFVGDSSYRYTWVLHQGGGRVALETVATPLGVAISHRGDLLAVGTGTNDVWLFTPDGTLLWRRHLEGGCCARELSFSEDDEVIVVSGWGGGVISADGEVQWSGTGLFSVSSSRNHDTFLGRWTANHGPPMSSITLMEAEGNALWSIADRRVMGVVSPAGDRVAAFVGDLEAANVRILSRAGDTLLTLNQDSWPVAFSPDDRLLLEDLEGLQIIDLEGNLEWSIEKPYATRFLATPDLSLLILWDRERIRLFETG